MRGEGAADTAREDEQKRIRWRCRRGMLELDIVLGRFVDRHYAGLDKEARAAFDALLDMPDAVLWDMITGRGNDGKEEPPEEYGVLLKMIRSA